MTQTYEPEFTRQSPRVNLNVAALLGKSIACRTRYGYSKSAGERQSEHRQWRRPGISHYFKRTGQTERKNESREASQPTVRGVTRGYDARKPFLWAVRV